MIIVSRSWLMYWTTRVVFWPCLVFFEPLVPLMTLCLTETLIHLLKTLLANKVSVKYSHDTTVYSNACNWFEIRSQKSQTHNIVHKITDLRNSYRLMLPNNNVITYPKVISIIFNNYFVTVVKDDNLHDSSKFIYENQMSKDQRKSKRIKEQSQIRV